MHEMPLFTTAAAQYLNFAVWKSKVCVVVVKLDAKRTYVTFLPDPTQTSICIIYIYACQSTADSAVLLVMLKQSYCAPSHVRFQTIQQSTAVKFFSD